MAEQSQSPAEVEIIDEDTVFSLIELCRSCSVDAEFIEMLVDEGILEPLGMRGSHWCFSSSSVKRTRITLHLQKDLGVNLAGAALALDLLERIDELTAQLRFISC